MGRRGCFDEPSRRGYATLETILPSRLRLSRSRTAATELARLCLKLAKAVGLPAASVELGVADGVTYLAVERYDRRNKRPDTLERIHHEDYGQALGIMPESKYQAEGGPSFRSCRA